jgi:hypothetical protein
MPCTNGSQKHNTVGDKHLIPEQTHHWFDFLSMSLGRRIPWRCIHVLSYVDVGNRIARSSVSNFTLILKPEGSWSREINAPWSRDTESIIDGYRVFVCLLLAGSWLVRYKMSGRVLACASDDSKDSRTIIRETASEANLLFTIENKPIVLKLVKTQKRIPISRGTRSSMF